MAKCRTANPFSDVRSRQLSHSNINDTWIVLSIAYDH